MLGTYLCIISLISTCMIIKYKCIPRYMKKTVVYRHDVTGVAAGVSSKGTDHIDESTIAYSLYTVYIYIIHNDWHQPRLPCTHTYTNTQTHTHTPHNKCYVMHMVSVSMIELRDSYSYLYLL